MATVSRGSEVPARCCRIRGSGAMNPGQEFVDPRLRMARGDGFEGGFEIRVGLYAVHLRRFDVRGDSAPSRHPFVVAGEQRVFPGQGNALPIARSPESAMANSPSVSSRESANQRPMPAQGKGAARLPLTPQHLKTPKKHKTPLIQHTTFTIDRLLFERCGHRLNPLHQVADGPVRRRRPRMKHAPGAASRVHGCYPSGSC